MRRTIAFKLKKKYRGGYHVACAILGHTIIASSDCNCTHHAEVGLLNKLKKLNLHHRIKWNRLTIIVVRVITDYKTGDFTYGMSKPCLHCTNTLKKSNVKNIAWSNEEGKIVTCKTCELQSTHISHGNRTW
tara:strand:- start:64 stop:456 length:393 start_codon:yes stop_codon:yes gene_type:complete